MSLSSDLDRLEQSGQWTQALEMLRKKLSFGWAVDADHLHSMGRLYQRLGVFASAKRAYVASLRMDPERALTCNNLSLLALHQLQPAQADEWLMRGLALARTLHEQDLLHAVTHVPSIHVAIGCCLNEGWDSEGSSSHGAVLSTPR